MAEPAATPPELEPITRSWEAAIVDTARIQAELDAMWTAWRDRKLASRSPEDPKVEPLRMRPSTLNLIIAADSETAASEALAAITAIVDIQPSRTILIHEGGVAPDSDQFRIELIVSERPHTRHRSPVSIELVTISAAAGHGEQLASTISPLLLPDLPDILYIASNSLANNRLAIDLVDHVDGLLFDSSTCIDAAADLAFLAKLAREDGSPALADMAWYRIGPWRQWTAQFFDPPAIAPCLNMIVNVAVCYGEGDTRGRGGFTGALLMSGWLATRLQWRAPGELVEAENGWKSTLRSGATGKNREILLTIQPGTARTGRCTLESMDLHSGGVAPGTFHLERVDESSVSAASEVFDTAPANRIVYNRVMIDSAIFSEVLKFGTADPLYLEALAVATTLWPAGEAEA